MKWKEFRFLYGEKKGIEYHYKQRKLVLDILEKHNVPCPLILSEPNYVLVRIDVDDKTAEIIKDEFIKTLNQLDGSFSDITLESWDAEEDARNRISNAPKKLGLNLEEGKGWGVSGREPLNNHWILFEDDFELKVKEYATFMTKVVGKFTKAFIDEMPRRIEDRWMLSVMIHLLLNSIAVHLQQEKDLRDFPIV